MSQEKFDYFQGGVGQKISYFDNTVSNNGTYRLDEYVDVEYNGESEGPTLGWIESGEWVEYTIRVEEPGYYDLSYRYASDISNGGGPFFLELNGDQISNNLYAGNTGGWYNWFTESVLDIALNAGEHTLRLVFIDGGFNLGRMTFTFDRELDYNPPYADAGEDL